MKQSILSIQNQRARTLILGALCVICLLVFNSCADGIHLYDQTQVPVVTVQNRAKPVFSFTPDTAYILRVYQGKQDRDGLDVYWKITGGEGYNNKLSSPVTYAGPALESGTHYTVTVERKDPKGSGDGFTNTRHKYVGQKVFIAKYPSSQ